MVEERLAPTFLTQREARLQLDAGRTEIAVCLNGAVTIRAKYIYDKRRYVSLLMSPCFW